jgi:hypothetical protein
MMGSMMYGMISTSSTSRKWATMMIMMIGSKPGIRATFARCGRTATARDRR